MDKVPMTNTGYNRLDNELKERKQVKRPQIIDAISEARAHGDLSENAEYHAAKEEQGLNEGRISELESKISRAQVIDPLTVDSDRIVLSATVDLVDVDTDKEVTYILVGPDEADIDRNLMSVTSPIGRALLGKEEGDEITIKTPGGERCYEVLAVKYIEIAA